MIYIEIELTWIVYANRMMLCVKDKRTVEAGTSMCVDSEQQRNKK